MENHTGPPGLQWQQTLVCSTGETIVLFTYTNMQTNTDILL